MQDIPHGALPTNCVPQAMCYNPVTREKFWGFVTIILLLDELRNGTDPRLDLLKQKRYLWSMTRPWTSTEVKPAGSGPEYVFCASKTPPKHPVKVPLQVSNNNWTVYLAPAEGWAPAWEAGMIALVVLGSVVLAILIAIIMAFWAQQAALLTDVLVRQYNLINVLDGSAGRTHGTASDGSATSKEAITLGTPG
ncbi:uncharacterized protein HaLaN_05539 [Haematococcus lacustris]|uniref:Uncharacterized protein n=1 Tax=Haematococcus lacustris TaxID=44745 RepID=A0A699YR72_HAELA|nr:uncharacterized protein HaLaN_05539 [Haematococcus lacustris]